MPISSADHVTESRNRFKEKINNREWTVTTELTPPKQGDLDDAKRYDRDLHLTNKLIREEYIDSATLRDAPPFSPKLAKGIRWIKDFMRKRKMESLLARKIRGVLAEVQSRRPPEEVIPPDRYIAPVINQTHPMEVIHMKLNTAIHHQNALAVFAASGGDPRRRLAHLIERGPRLLQEILTEINPTWFSAPTNVLDTAEAFNEGQAEGIYPDNISLWGVWDQNKEPEIQDELPIPEDCLSYCIEKNDKRVVVFLTNPLFIRDSFDPLLQEMKQRGLNDKLQIKVGLPYLLSVENFLFWQFINGLDPHHSDVLKIREAFERAEKDGTLRTFRRNWNKEFILQLSSIPDVTGIHFMAPAYKEGSAVLKEALIDKRYRSMPSESSLRALNHSNE